MKKWSLNAKLIAIMGLFVSTSVGIAFLGMNRMNAINDALNNLSDKVFPRALAAKTIDGLTASLRGKEKAFILEESQEGMQKLGVILDDTEKEVYHQLDIWDALANEAAKKEIAEIRSLLGEWRPVSLQVRKLSLAGQNKEAFALSWGKSGQILDSIDKILKTAIDRNTQITKDEGDRTDAVVAHARNSMIIISLLSILAGVTAAFFTLRALSKAIDQVIADLRDSAGQLSGASQQVASASEQLSSACSEQAASLEETATALEEVQAMVQKNTDNSQSAANTSLTSQESAKKGKATVQEMIEAIGMIEQSNAAIMTQIDQSNQQISEIVTVITEIGTKTKVINDIVFQTKLLSFNASVEAARAGEHGKGFAVVAEEVGNLAQMSGSAAKEISSMLEESTRKVESIVSDTKSKVSGLMKTGSESIQNGTRIAHSCDQALDEIVKSVSTVTASTGEISVASIEQSKGIGEINKAMSQLDTVTQQNAASSEEAASAAEELSAQAETLRTVVQTLVQTIKGDNDAARASNGYAASSSSSPAPGAKVLQLKKRASNPAELNAVPSGAVPANADVRFKDV